VGGLRRNPQPGVLAWPKARQCDDLVL